MKKQRQRYDGETRRHPVIVFDGVCNLCSGLVNFIIRRDRKGVFRFAAMQSDAGAGMLSRIGRPSSGADSVLLVDGKGVAVKSDAILRAAAILGGVWKIAALFRFVPRRIRDVLYDFAADHRYRWFGTRNACSMLDDDVRSRYL